MLRSFEDFRVSWVRRSANVALHKLAKIGVGEELCKVQLGSPLDCILDVIADEIMGRPNSLTNYFDTSRRSFSSV